MPRSIEGKSAIVTGAGSGINLEFARLLIKHGVNVLIADLTLRPEAQELVDNCQREVKGPKLLFEQTDVTSWKALSNMFQVAEKHFGNVDIVCPGAGVFEPPFSSFWYPPGSQQSKDDPFGDSYKSLDINLSHAIRTTQLAISHFMASGASAGNQKTIVHISSVAGEIATLAVPLYHATKWGLVGFVRSLAELEAGYGIRVAAVAPGVVKTPLWLDHEDKRRTIEVEGQIQKEWVTPEEVAEVMLSIVTEDEASSAEGGRIPIQGGSILEVTNGNIRDVPMFGNSGPVGKGLIMENRALMMEEVHNALRVPSWGKF